MILKISDNIDIWQKYNPVEISINRDFLSDSTDSASLSEMISSDIPTKIRIKNTWYNVLSKSKMYRMKSEIDNKYHFIYIQINIETNEYYIGKVNRPNWKEIIRYQGSGLRFKSKHAKHSEEFIKYYIASCSSAKECEYLEAKIVDAELLSDPKCLNLVTGGGGTSGHLTSDERKQKQREFMKEHPEQYQEMLKTAKKLFGSGTTQALIERNNKIKSTMNDDKYREMSRTRIKNWKEKNPEAYQQAREKNRIATQSEESRNKKRLSREKWIEENPEAYAIQMKNLHEKNNTADAREKRKISLAKWRLEHPEEAKFNDAKRAEASKKRSQKAVNMLDLETGKVLQSFESAVAAAEWLVENKLAKSINCKSSISAVCLKQKCSSGYGYRKKAYGYGWEFAK